MLGLAGLDGLRPTAGVVMTRTLASLAALLISMGILLLGSGLLGTLLAVRMGSAELRTDTIGLVMAGYSVGFVIGTLVCANVIQKVGHIRGFTVFCAIACCSALAHGLYEAPGFWLVMRLVFGFSIAGLYMVTESWLNDRTPREFRGRVVSLYIIVTSTSLGAGQFLLTLWDVSGFQLFSLAAMLLAAGLIPVALTRSRSPDLQPTRRLGLRRLYRISPLATVTASAAGLINGAFYALAPVFVVEIGLSVYQVSTFMGSTIVGGLFLQYVIGRLSDRYPRARVIMVVAGLVGGLSALIGSLAGAPFWQLLAFSVCWGGLNFTLYALALALANDHVASEQRVAASATLLLTNGLGMVAGPILLSLAMRGLGPGGLFFGFALIALCVSLFAWARSRVGDALSVDDQGNYRAAPQTMAATQYSVELQIDTEDPQMEFDFEDLS